MTKKHFKELAQRIKNLSLPLTEAEERAVKKIIAKELAEFCKSQNANFDEERFLKACEINY